MTQRTGSTAAESNEILRFGPFRLDPAARELRRGDEEIAVPPKSMACLMYLIARRDRAVDRDELIEAIWGHSHLTDGALAQTILQLRKALGDGEGTHFVKSVRGYGYRWAAETLVEQATDDNRIAADPSVATQEAAPHSPAPAPAPKKSAYGLLAVSLLAVTLSVVAGIVWHFVGARGDGSSLNSAAVSDGLVLVLPVEVFDAGESDWVRLGIMDMISTRLRRSGLAVVPVETVLQLLRGHGDESPAEQAKRLVEATGSRWILAVSARSVEHRWSVSIRGLTEHGPINVLRGDASEVLEATHQAVDVLALTLGIPTGSTQGGDPKLQLLVHRAQAAVLERRFDQVLALIDEAPAELRVLPEIQLLIARTRFEQRSYPLARELFERLLQDPAAMQDPELILRAQVNLAATLAAVGELDAAQSMMLDIVNRTDANLDPRVMANVNGNLGVTAVGNGDRVAAKRYFMQAQRFLTGGGDIHALAKLDFLIGVLEDQEDRPSESLRHLERARAGFDAVGDARGSARVRAAMIAAQLQLLDVLAAAAIEPMFLSISASSPTGEDPSEAQLVLASLWRVQGRNTQAWANVHALIADTGDDPVAAKYRLAANSLRARWLVEEGGPADQAIQAARAVTDSEDALKDGQQRAVVAEAWLAQIRAEIRLRRMDEARRALSRFAAWPGHDETPTTKVFLSLARAELADAGSRLEEARMHYDDALQTSDSAGTPRLTLDVARSFVPWLLRQPGGAVEAMWVSDKLNVHHDRHFDAALIRLRVLQRNGPVASWRAALRVAESLAGDRSIPAELLSAPTTATD